jgi:Skp family chaperone for outer membrane proteins
MPPSIWSRLISACAGSFSDPSRRRSLRRRAAVMDDMLLASKEALTVKISRVAIRWSAIVAVVSIVVVAALVVSRSAHGQNPSNPQNIAVIDIAKILKNDEKFKQEMQNMQTEILATEKQLQSDAKEIQALASQQKQLAAGTPDYSRLDAEITKRTADLNVQKSIKQKEFVERQSKMLFNMYSEIQDAVRQFSQRYNIGLVMQYDSSKIDPNDPQAILSGAHRSIVYVYPPLDITNDILANLNRSPQVGQMPQGVAAPGGYQR